MWIRVGMTAMYPDIRDQVRFARAVEALGYDLAGYGDTQSLLPDVFVGLAAMASATQRVLLASTVGNPVTRHPAVIASAAAGLQRLSGGRFRYGVGTGDSAVRLAGVRAARVADMEEFCLAFRDLVHNREAKWRGKPLRLQFDADPVPLWLAAEGPRMLELAGRVADGVVMGNGVSEEVVRGNIAHIERGAAAAGRSLDEIELWFMAKPYLAASEEQAIRETAFSLAASANHAFRHTLEGKYLPERLHSGMRRLLDGYDSAHHNVAAKGAGHAALVFDNGLDAYLGSRFLIAGPPDRIADRIRELERWGASNLLFAGVFGDPIEYASSLRTQVLARI
jgi:5,10-methylenetetrahydromethanopterin reductase